MIVRVQLAVEIEVEDGESERAARLRVEQLCMDALEEAGLDPVSCGVESRKH